MQNRFVWFGNGAATIIHLLMLLFKLSDLVLDSHGETLG